MGNIKIVINWADIPSQESYRNLSNSSDFMNGASNPGVDSMKNHGILSRLATVFAISAS